MTTPNPAGSPSLGTIDNHSTLTYDELDQRDPFHTIDVQMQSNYDETGTIDTGYSHYESSQILADGTVIARVVHDEHELIDTTFHEDEQLEAVDIQRTETSISDIEVDASIAGRLWVTGKRGVNGVPLANESHLGVRVFSDYTADGETHSIFHDNSNLTTTGTPDPAAVEGEEPYDYVTSGTAHTDDSYQEIISSYTLTEEQDVTYIEKDYASAHQFAHEEPISGVLPNGMRVISPMVTGDLIVRGSHTNDSITETGDASAFNSTIVDITHPGDGSVTYAVQADVTSDYDYTLGGESRFYSTVSGGATNRAEQTNGSSNGSSIYDYHFTQTDTPGVHPTTQEPVVLTTSQADYTLDTTWDYDFLTTGTIGVNFSGSSGYDTTEHVHELGTDHQEAVTTSQTDAEGVLTETDHRERLTDYSGGSHFSLTGSGSHGVIVSGGASRLTDVDVSQHTGVTYQFHEDAVWDEGVLTHYELTDIRDFGDSYSVDYGQSQPHAVIDGRYAGSWLGSYTRTITGETEHVVTSQSRTASQTQTAYAEWETIVGTDAEGNEIYDYAVSEENEYGSSASSTLTFDATYTLSGVGGQRTGVTINSYVLDAETTEFNETTAIDIDHQSVTRADATIEVDDTVDAGGEPTSRLMSARIILGIGTGRCGTASLAEVFDRQVGFSVTHEKWPLLAWRPRGEARGFVAARFARMRRQRGGVAVVGDVASFYLPYLPAALDLEPDLVVVCLKRPREEVVASFETWLDRVFPLPMDFWTAAPGPGRHHDPRWAQVMPQYDDPVPSTRADGIRRYWDEYYAEVERLQQTWPERIRVFPTDGLGDRETLKEILKFVGVPEGTQTLPVGVRKNVVDNVPEQTRPVYEPHDPRRCVVLVPFQSHILRACEQGLIELECRGYDVRRISGYANIDLGRSQMATDALIAGFEKTMWIDADVEFDPDDVERLRAHGEPITCGIYPKKGQRALACHVLPGTQSLTFGKEGGLAEILYAATGFLHVRRGVYETIQCRLPLPLSNTRFGRPLVPFFEPLTKSDEDGHWTMTEDYSFCERARQCGFQVMADTTIRLTHHGSYGYTWEDAGSERQRFATYRYHFDDGSQKAPS